MTRVEQFRHRERLGKLFSSLDQWVLPLRIRRWRALAEKPTRRAERLILEKRIVRSLQKFGRPYGLDGRIYSASRSGFLSERETWQHAGSWMDWTI